MKSFSRWSFSWMSHFKDWRTKSRALISSFSFHLSKKIRAINTCLIIQSYIYGQMYHITLDFLYLKVLNHSIWIVIFFFKTKLLASKSVDDLDFFFLVLKAFFKNKGEKGNYNLLNSNIHIDICDIYIVPRSRSNLIFTSFLLICFCRVHFA